MWIVKNLLRGTLTFKGLGVSIPPKTEFDLDRIGREKADQSNQIMVAFEEGYLQNIYKEPQGGGAGDGKAGITEEQLQGRLREFKEAIVADLRSRLPGVPIDGTQPAGHAELKNELDAMRQSIVGDVRDMLKNLRIAKVRLQEERERILVDNSLTDVEVRARLAFLEEQEREIEKNFQKIGREVGGEKGTEGDLINKADLLSEI